MVLTGATVELKGTGELTHVCVDGGFESKTCCMREVPWPFYCPLEQPSLVAELQLGEPHYLNWLK